MNHKLFKIFFVFSFFVLIVTTISALNLTMAKPALAHTETHILGLISPTSGGNYAQNSIMKVKFRTQGYAEGMYGVFVRYSPPGEYYQTNYYYCTAFVLADAVAGKTEFEVDLPLNVPLSVKNNSYQVIVAYMSSAQHANYKWANGSGDSPAWDVYGWYTSPWSFNVTCSTASCGTSNGKTSISPPSSGFCKDGSNPTVTGTGVTVRNEPCYYGLEPEPGESPCLVPPHLDSGNSWRWTCNSGTSASCGCGTLATDSSCLLRDCNVPLVASLIKPTDNLQIASSEDGVAVVDFTATSDGCKRNGKLSYYKAAVSSEQRSVDYSNIPAEPKTHEYTSPRSGTFLTDGTITYDPKYTVTLPSGKKATEYYWGFQVEDIYGGRKEATQRRFYVLEPPPIPKTLNCTISPNKGSAPLTTKITAAGTAAGPYNFVVNDGSGLITRTEPKEFLYTFKNPGLHVVNVSSTEGVSGSCNVNVALTAGGGTSSEIAP